MHIDRAIFERQKYIVNKATGRTKVNYLNGLIHYYNKTFNQLHEVRKEYLSYFRENESMIFEKNRFVLYDV